MPLFFLVPNPGKHFFTLHIVHMYSLNREKKGNTVVSGSLFRMCYFMPEQSDQISSLFMLSERKMLFASADVQWLSSILWQQCFWCLRKLAKNDHWANWKPAETVWTRSCHPSCHPSQFVFWYRPNARRSLREFSELRFVFCGFSCQQKIFKFIVHHILTVFRLRDWQSLFSKSLCRVIPRWDPFSDHNSSPWPLRLLP